MTGKRIDFASPLVTFTISMLVRILYLSQYRHSPFYWMPLWDAADYHGIALALTKLELHSALPFRPPLYPLMLGLTYLVFGVSPLVPRLLQIVLGSISCVLVQQIASKLFGKRQGALAGWLAALSGLMLYFDLELLPTTVTVFLLLMLVKELINLPEKKGSGIRTGLIYALGCLTRPTLLAVFPVVLWWIIGRRIGWRKTGAVVVSAVVVLSASLLLHLAAGWGPVLVSAQGGVNFFIGNHRTSDGITARFPGIGAGWSWEQMQNWAQSNSESELNLTGIDRSYYKAGFKEILADPGGWLKRLGRKSRLYWNHFEISNNRDLYYHSSRFPLFGFLLRLGFPLLLAPAFIGIVLHWKKPEVRLIAVMILFFFLTTILFFVTARFRHPMLPLLIILAVGGVCTIFGIIRDRARLKTIPWVRCTAALLCGIMLPWSVDSGLDTGQWDYGLFTEGMAWQRLGEFDKAEDFYQQALESNPTAPYVHSRLANIARREGDYQGAIDHYQRELEIQPDYFESWNNLGIVFERLDDENRALECFEVAASLQPYTGEAAINAGRIWGMRAGKATRSADWTSAEAYARRALAYDDGSPYYQSLLETALKNLAAETIDP